MCIKCTARYKITICRTENTTSERPHPEKENSSSIRDNYPDWSIDDSTVDVDAAATSLLLVPSARFGASSVRPTSQEPFHYLSCAGTSTTVDNGDSAMMMIGRIRFKGSS